jgi:K+-sensing histidine kinase KdpD
MIYDQSIESQQAEDTWEDHLRLESELRVLTEVAKTLTSPLELPELLEAALRCMAQVLEPAEAGVIMLWDPSAGLFRAAASIGFDREALGRIGIRSGESITGKVYDSGQAWLLENQEAVSLAMGNLRTANLSYLQRARGRDGLPESCLAAPLQVDGRRFGVLVLQTLHKPLAFAYRDLPFVQSLADLVALTIDRANLQAQADASRQARQEEHMRSEVMAALSHQLRMPLSAIKGYASALLLEELGWSEAKRREFLEMIDEECDGMETLIAEMLDSALIDIGQLKPEPQPLRLPRLAEEMAGEVQRRSEQHHLLVDFPPDFPLVEADPHWIKQVFRNVLDNAVKYSPEGGLIVIRGEARPADVLITVADQGLGISPEDLIPLFEKYFRARHHNGYHISGTGLGLPIARAIIEAHDGRIWAESKLGEGTTVFFTLPLLPSPAEEAA